MIRQLARLLPVACVLACGGSAPPAQPAAPAAPPPDECFVQRDGDQVMATLHRQAQGPDVRESWSLLTITPNTSQRDLVRLALLMCGDRPGAKYSKPFKGVQDSRNEDPTRGYSR